MKIVQILTRSDNIGGAQIHVKDLTSKLKEHGHEVWVLVGGNGVFTRELINSNQYVKVIEHLIREINPLKDLLAYWEIRRALKDIGPDLVATHTSKAGILGRLAAWSLGIPTLYTAHGWSFIQEAGRFKRKLLILAERCAGQISSAVITVSKYDFNYCLKHKLAPKGRVKWIYNGVPDRPKEISNQTTQSPCLVMTARLEKPKNHLDLLKALRSLTSLQWKLQLVGDGPLRTQIEKQIDQFGLASRVVLLGATRNVPQILEKANVFVLISNMEGLPLSVLEAMRASLPVVAYDVGGISEIIEDGYSGLLIPKGDVELLTARLRSLILDTELRLKLGLAARKEFEQRFRLEDMVMETLAIYGKVLR